LFFLRAPEFSPKPVEPFSGRWQILPESVLVGVAITVTNEGTNAIRSLTTDELGLYRAELLLVGSYSVQVEYSGFKTTKIAGINVDVQQTVGTDVLMQLGAVTEKVDVTSEAPLLKTDAADVDAVVSEKEVVDLPLSNTSERRTTKCVNHPIRWHWGIEVPDKKEIRTSTYLVEIFSGRPA
jgi:hypothetical protein